MSEPRSPFQDVYALVIEQQCDERLWRSIGPALFVEALQTLQRAFTAAAYTAGLPHPEYEPYEISENGRTYMQVRVRDFEQRKAETQ